MRMLYDVKIVVGVYTVQGVRKSSGQRSLDYS